jgi:hypothetical protein
MNFDLFAVLQQLWAGLVVGLGGDVANVLAIGVLVFLGFIATLLVTSIRRTEFFKQNEYMWDMIDNHIADLIFMVALGKVELEPYEERARERQEEGLSEIDPRMLYLLDQIEGWIKARFRIEIDLEMLHARAERILDLVKNDPDNSVE